jgi:hypothetical protein
MICVTSIGYRLEPEFLLKAPSQPGMRERIERAFNENRRVQARAKLRKMVMIFIQLQMWTFTAIGVQSTNVYPSIERQQVRVS